MYQSLSSGHIKEPEKFEESGFPMYPSPLSEAAQYLHICWVAVKPNSIQFYYSREYSVLIWVIPWWKVVPMLHPSPLSEAAPLSDTISVEWPLKPILFNSIIPGNIPSWYELLHDEKSSARNTERVHNKQWHHSHHVSGLQNGKAKQNLFVCVQAMV